MMKIIVKGQISKDIFAKKVILNRMFCDFSVLCVYLVLFEMRAIVLEITAVVFCSD
ncbi:protein of unknown function [Maridesulfovibrio hydrothermalis AM13 = DSM 14728]|uniref:Uncharacterized protein n=1 Tax=Maridesulfovibrio hydrothermalis AM13 = DSM 14728 TaxID=1121451 RepID=L0RIM4_9BACT|nr:protein of unknown function [Maridesulfovibrio hydrothermalis AM13 = DSM 14728]